MQHSQTFGYDSVFPLRSSEWDDVRVPISAVKLGAAKPPALQAYKGGVVLAFADEAVEVNEERVTFILQLPHSYEEGTDIEAHLHWVGEDQTAGNVNWKLTASWANPDEAFPGESDYYALAANNTALADAHTYTDFTPNLTGTGKEISSMVICTLRRNSNNVADTFAGKDAYLLEIDFHFEMNTLGSLTENAK